MKCLRHSERLNVALLCLTLSLPLSAQPIPEGEDRTLVAEIVRSIDVPGLQTGFQGIFVQSLKDGRVLFALHSEKTFVPASNNKLLTTCIALEKLGADFVYRTRVMRDGAIDRQGALKGDLILVGSGDPVLTPEALRSLAQQVRQSGIRRVRGAVRFDDTLFDAQTLGPGWAWDDEPFAYSAQVSALNVHGNTVRLRVLPGNSPGRPAIVQITPENHYTRVINQVSTAPPGAKTGVHVERERGTNTIRIHGAVAQNTPERDCPEVTVTVEQPARFTGFLFVNYLRESGVRVDRPLPEPVLKSTKPVHRSVVAEHISVPLVEILKRLNKSSDNLIAECLLKTVGVIATGKGTSGAEGTGAKVALDWFLRIGLDTERVRMDDGSGLTRTNFVSPRNIVRLLTYMRQSEHFRPFYESLPIAGVDGTLRNRMRSTSAYNNCRAKTGTLSFVSTLSGYVTTRDGEELAFAIMMNNHLAPGNVARAAQDRIVTLLADHTCRPEETAPQQE